MIVIYHVSPISYLVRDASDDDNNNQWRTKGINQSIDVGDRRAAGAMRGAATGILERHVGSSRPFHALFPWHCHVHQERCD